ncbi:Membrane-bound transcription factor site-2 protease [Podochytrium sp. JEL0797]|nr:Membrane-bound transcription factor site-2 protease [Podochytrium sp. JEL0797]
MLVDFVLSILGFWTVVHCLIVLLRSRYPNLHRRIVNKSLPINKAKPEDNEAILPQHATTDSQALSSFPFILSYSPFSLKATTTAFNSAIWNMFRNPIVSRFLRLWFNCGVAFGCLALAGSVAMAGFSCIRVGRDLWVGKSAAGPVQVTGGLEANWWNVSVGYTKRPLAYSSGPNLESPTNGRFLVSLIPGVNLPFYAIGYYFLSLFLAGVFHEMGHAVAGATEQVPMRSAGIFLSLIYPGAFVDLDEHSLTQTSALAKLRIICAGVWHNAVFALTCLASLSCMSVWLAWGYRDLRGSGSGEAWKGGVVVLEVEKSSLFNENLPVGTVVVGLDDTRIESGVNDWDLGISRALESGEGVMQGYCVENEVVSTNAQVPCCNVNLEMPLGDYSNPFQCFLPREEVGLRPTVELSKATLESSPKACLSLESVLRVGTPCTSDIECNASGSQRCMAAYIPNPYIRIVRLQILDIVSRKDLKKLMKQEGIVANETLGVARNRAFAARKAYDGDGEEGGVVVGKRNGNIPTRTVLYLGDPREISTAVRVGCFFPKLRICPLSIPYKLERFLHFLISFNAALSIMNMIPAQDMDGYHAVGALLDWAIETSVNGNGRITHSLFGNMGTSRLRILKERSLKIVGRISTLLLGILLVVATVGAIL